jgi:hypothetical protein
VAARLEWSFAAEIIFSGGGAPWSFAADRPPYPRLQVCGAAVRGVPLPESDTSGKHGFSPGSFGPLVPVAQPGLDIWD